MLLPCSVLLNIRLHYCKKILNNEMRHGKDKSSCYYIKHFVKCSHIMLTFQDENVWLFSFCILIGKVLKECCDILGRGCLAAFYTNLLELATRFLERVAMLI